MDIKQQLTDLLAKKLNWSDSETKEKYHVIWQNTRRKEIGGMRLTEEGFRLLTEELDLQTYEIEMPKEIIFTNQVVIWLDKYIDGPYYLNKKTIVVFKEKTAVQLVLFSGNVQKFGLAKSINERL